MPVVIDYPVSGPVSTPFPVGGTYSLPKKPGPAPAPAPPAGTAPPTVTAYLYSSSGALITSTVCPTVPKNLTWSGALDANNTSYTDCYIIAQLSTDNSTDQVNGIDVVSNGGGGGITSTTMAGP